MKKAIFLHGFYSSGSCPMANALKEALRGEVEVLTPDLPLHPKAALAFVRDLCKQEHPDMLIGNSNGAFFAQMLATELQIPALLGNPHLKMSEFVAARIGENRYKSPRMDGKQDFVIDDALIDEFEGLQMIQFNKHSEAKVWGIFGDNDPIAHYEPMFLEHYTESFHFPGEHTPTAEEINAYHVPLIKKMLE